MYKICFVLRSSFFTAKGGAELQAFLIAKELSKKGYEVHYILESKKDVFSNNIIWHNLPPLQKKFWATFLNYPNLKKVIEKIKPDIIYQRCRHEYTGMVANICQKNNIKFIFASSSDKAFTIKYQITNLKSILKLPTLKISEFGIKKADQIIVQHKQQNRLLLKNFDKKGIVIPNSHKVPSLPFDKNIPPIILWIANIKKWKQPELFIKLAKKLEDENAKFVMVGRPFEELKYQKKLENAIDKIPNLTYLGDVPFNQTNMLLRKASIFVNTSLPMEGFPNTYIQSWMRKVPVVALNFDPNGILTREDIGIKAGNFNNLVTSVIDLINNPEKRRKMGDKARNYAIQNYDIKINILQYEKIFDGLMCP